MQYSPNHHTTVDENSSGDNHRGCLSRDISQREFYYPESHPNRIYLTTWRKVSVKPVSLCYQSILSIELRSNFYTCSSYYADFLFKFLVIGSAGTGKSCLLHQFIEKECKCQHSTLGECYLSSFFSYCDAYKQLGLQ